MKPERLILLSLNLSAAVLERDQHLEELFALIDEQPLAKGWQLVHMSFVKLLDAPEQPSNRILEVIQAMAEELELQHQGFHLTHQSPAVRP